MRIERPSDGDTLRHAAGQRLWQRRAVAAEAYVVDQPFNPLHVEFLAGRIADIFGNRQPGHQAGFLKDEGDRRRVRRSVFFRRVDRHCAGKSPVQTCGDAQQRALSAAARPEKNRRFAITEPQMNVLKDNGIAKGLFAYVYLKQAHRNRPPSCRG